jgi:hypothetical protein
MDELFEYPEDRGEIYQAPNEEEAHLYFTIADFGDLIEKYGVDFVMNRVRYPIYMKIYRHFEDLE